MAIAPTTPAALLPPLENGDRLTRAEFHRRYEARPDLRKAELIEGVVHVPSPVRARDHGQPEALLGGWLSHYWAGHPELSLVHNATVLIDLDNEVQPDLSLRRAEGGASQITAEGYIQGPPELVAEIAASSASIDLHAKKNVYRRNGVQEYLAWRVYDNAVDWFSLQEGDYVRLDPSSAGIIESGIFPGLRLDVAKLLAGDLAGVIAALDAPG
ncbi:MAG: Uma2 family endonuclease [Chloroflexi bacterium]|nr:Uma2 family endonuclease [Chloroflexota bacterium]